MKKLMLCVLMLCASAALSQAYREAYGYNLRDGGRSGITFAARSITVMPYKNVAPVTVWVWAETTGVYATDSLCIAFNNDTTAAKIIVLHPNVITTQPWMVLHDQFTNVQTMQVKGTRNMKFGTVIH